MRSPHPRPSPSPSPSHSPSSTHEPKPEPSNRKPSREQVSDFDIEWAPQSYAANQHLPAAKGKDYALLQTDTHRMKPVTFSGPLPHLDTPWAA